MWESLGKRSEITYCQSKCKSKGMRFLEVGPLKQQTSSTKYIVSGVIISIDDLKKANEQTRLEWTCGSEESPLAERLQLAGSH
jgi:hypothetical protein